MEPLEQRVAAFVEANAMFKEPSRVLLAVSGGADSISLLHAMHALTIQGSITAELACIHIDHQLRGADSLADAAFAAEQAKRLGVPFELESVDVRAYAQEYRLSVETAGRRVRLACFAQAAQRLGCRWVATGHQRNDNAETVLQRLRRGTGYRGLRGIVPVRPLQDDVMLARPLLSCTRSEIVTYLRSRKLLWREDRTNADCSYARNFIRWRLLPTLERQCRCSLVEELTELAASAARLHDKIYSQAEQAAAQSVRPSGDCVAVEAQALAALPEPVATELIRMQLTQLGCGERDLTRHHYAAVLQLAQPQANRGPVLLPGGYRAQRYCATLILSRPPAGRRHGTVPDSRVEIPIPGSASFNGCEITATVLEQKPGRPIEIPADKGTFVEYLDLDNVRQPLFVRERRPGDSFRPLGLGSPKKVGKFLTDARVPAGQRERIMIFDDGQKIVWVCPVRISEQVKVTAKTQRAVVLTVRRNQ